MLKAESVVDTIPTHLELSEITAEWALKNTWVALCEYQSYASGEFPDVLTFSGKGTALYEIKVSRTDFKADHKKDARKKWKPKIATYYRSRKDVDFIKACYPDLYYIDAPHLGVRRYYVCPSGLIRPEEIPEGWGLYWFDGAKFRRKLDSKKWRADVRTERNLLAHALRRYANGDHSSVKVHMFPEESE